jgi:hypothetical protein
MPDSTPAVAVRPAREPPAARPLRPPVLRVVKNACLKPTTRAEGARTVEQDAALPPGVLSATNDGMWE